MAEEVIILKDLKLVPDKYYDYTQSLRNSKTAIVIDNGNILIKKMYNSLVLVVSNKYLFILSGSFTCKAGWATSSVPNLIFKNILARPRKERGKKVTKTSDTC